jgi:hypothetical protein
MALPARPRWPAMKTGSVLVTEAAYRASCAPRKGRTRDIFGRSKVFADRISRFGERKIFTNWHAAVDEPHVLSLQGSACPAHSAHLSLSPLLQLPSSPAGAARFTATCIPHDGTISFHPSRSGKPNPHRRRKRLKQLRLRCRLPFRHHQSPRRLRRRPEPHPLCRECNRSPLSRGRVGKIHFATRPSRLVRVRGIPAVFLPESAQASQASMEDVALAFAHVRRSGWE